MIYSFTAGRNLRQCTSLKGFEPRPLGQNSLEGNTSLDFFCFRTSINDKSSAKYRLDKYIFSLLDFSNFPRSSHPEIERSLKTVLTAAYQKRSLEQNDEFTHFIFWHYRWKMGKKISTVLGAVARYRLDTSKSIHAIHNLDFRNIRRHSYRIIFAQPCQKNYFFGTHTHTLMTLRSKSKYAVHIENVIVNI